jgi:CheY-like chemotaxis protein
MSTVYTAFLIDDDEDDHLFFQMAIDGVGIAMKCEFARDCFCAIERIKDPLFKPDVIFIDINMPRMNGIECLAAIKKTEHLKDVPVYMYSTSADPDVIQRCVAKGAKDLIKKRPNIEQMSQELMRIMSDIIKLNTT